MSRAISLFPIWSGKTAFCIATGPSLTQEQVDVSKDYFTIAINDAYTIAPWADILYACDRQWWDWHDGCPHFKQYKLQHHNLPENREHSTRLPPYPGIDYIYSDGRSGFSDRLDRIRTGGNSGYQALHMAIQLGASEVVLLGYDMKPSEKSHFFGEHPIGRGSDDRYRIWRNEYPALQQEALNRGVRVVNCTPDSALDCFEKSDISEFY